MNHLSILRHGFCGAISVALAVLAPAQASAQGPADDSANEASLDEVTVLGSRRVDARSAADKPVPVDVLSGDDLDAQGNTDIIDVLTSVIPSLNANREPISDAATLVRPVNLRALPADHTLVLVNGKRRHRGAVVGEFVSGVNRGAQGVDINPLFGMGMKQVEVLRDGAAAQYGSDAIAGVINYALLDDPDARKISVQYGQAYEGDGTTAELSAALGMHIGDEGFATVAFQLRDQQPTSRGVQDGEGTASGASSLEAAGFPVANPVVVWGQPEVKDDFKLMVNTAVPTDSGAEIYAFGTYAQREVDGSFFYRNPTSRQGVFASGADVLFADTTGAGGCPVGPLPTTSFVDAQAFIASAPDNCFAFQSMFPGGFTPRFGGSVKDSSFFAGIRGEMDNGLHYDVSAGFGENSLDYRIFNTINASLGPDTPTRFDLGRQAQSEIVMNADFAVPVPIAMFESSLNLAFGLQYQDEEFEIGAGDQASFAVGEFITQGFSAGANGFQGFSDDVAGTFGRDSVSAYLDLEADVTDSLMLSAAARYEDFSDFGDTFNGKLAALFQLTDGVGLRGSISTGFRAPTLGQSNLQRASTGFAGGQLVEQLVIASTNPIAVFFGGGQLNPEESENFSVGAAFGFGNLDLTVDYFEIDVENRVALVSATVDNAARAALIALGHPEAATISNVQFFVNDFDTSTKGIDVVANYGLETGIGSTDVTFAFNYNDTEVTDRGATVDDGRAREIEDALPDVRATLSLNHQYENFHGLLRINHYGESYESLFNASSLPVVTDPMLVVDAEVGWEFDGHFGVAIGAKNIFDEYPDEYETAGFTGRDGGFLGAIYPLNHPAGFNGGSYYIRFTADLQ